jgi:hypothetical protein
VRRKLIQVVFPFLFCLLPILAAGTVAMAIEVGAREFYLKNLTWMDVLILISGATLFLIQITLAWRALHWRGTSFDEGPDPWLSNLAQAAEWFPLLGLLGTVAAILHTFSSIKDYNAQEIIRNYAPAITATGSGLFMALINILPSWMVPVGRDLIRSLGGADAPAPPLPSTATPAPVSARSDSVRTGSRSPARAGDSAADAGS